LKIIYNNHFPFGRYWAINICGLIFARRQYGELGVVQRNHEFIHTLQQRELLFFPFYLLYIVEWGIKLCYYRNFYLAYSNISFEREAYAEEGNLNYRNIRKPYSWIKYLKVK